MSTGGSTPAVHDGVAPPVLRIALGTNNVYALPGDGGVTLIDAGPDYAGAWEELLAGLAGHGIAPRDVRTLVLTHQHLDHAGLAARWQATGAQILAGRHDAPAIAHDAAAHDAERAAIRREFLRHGMPPDLLAAPPPPAAAPRRAVPSAVRRASTPPAPPAHPSPAPVGASGDGVTAGQLLDPQRYTRWPSPLRMTALHVDRLLDHGDRITAADRQLRVVAVPGHTPGSLLLHDDGGALFTGDHVLPRMAPSSGIQFQDGRRIPSLPAYLAALQETRCLAGQTRTFYPGHGTPSTDLAAAVAWSIRLLEQRARRTLAALRRGPGSAYALALRIFPHLTPHHRRAALAECIGLLDLLATRGLAFARETSDAVIWQASPFTDAGAPGRQQSGSRSST